MKKKTICIVIVLLMLCTVLPQTTAYAASDGSPIWITMASSTSDTEIYTYFERGFDPTAFSQSLPEIPVRMSVG